MVDETDLEYVYPPGSEGLRIRSAADERHEALERRVAALEATQRTQRPRIVCLCGSTRFWREFQRQSLAETLAGRIVLSIGAASGTDDEHFGNLPRSEYEHVKAELDTLHLRKIDVADEILVLNVGGYVGESTRREIAYARSHGKPVRWLDPANAPQEASK